MVSSFIPPLTGRWLLSSCRPVFFLINEEIGRTLVGVDGNALFIIMGVSGSGKSTFGRAVAEAMGGLFLDADDFHTAEKKAKMHAGHPLTDEDRWPWLDRLNGELRADVGKGKPVFLACSALKQKYRDRLVVGLPQARWVYLKGSFELLSSRLGHRTGHFMPATLLQSQLDELEEPKDAMVIDVAQANEQLVEDFRARLDVD